MTHKTRLAALALSAAALSQAAPAAAADCGTAGSVTIAEMTWLSAATLAHVTQKILANGYGCDAQLVPGDTVPTATSMLTRSEPSIAPELWVSTVQAQWDQMQEKGNVYKASDIFSGGGQDGLWVPDYVLTEHPEIKSIEDLAANWQVFEDNQNPGKGRLYNGPPGWASEVIITNYYKALGLQDSFELFSPGSGENLKASIARAVAQHRPWVGYYWGPSDVVGKFKLVRLGMPDSDREAFTCLTDANCADPQVTGWAAGEVAVAVVADLKEQAPEVAEFLSKMQVPNDDISTVLAWGDDNGATPEEVAVHFLKEYPAIWTAWVPAEVAEKVQAGL
ncbi:glycine betaine ABC transporter substrate-binding protein [Tabrizicola sp.]|uniref:glycine betaine ABC transporter substrate-binding protein n=1 Tax=Tabrizicola sp. TaxID=2005166 RepID=UPI002FDE1B15